MASTMSFPPGPLRVANVGVSAGGTRILKMVDLTLHPGEMCALIGPSGAHMLSARNPARGRSLERGDLQPEPSRQRDS